MNERMTPPARACECRVEIALHGRVVGSVAIETVGEPPHITYCATHSAAAMKAALEEQCPGCKAKEQLVEHADGWWHHGAHWPWQCRNSDAARTALRSATPDDALREGRGDGGTQ